MDYEELLTLIDMPNYVKSKKEFPEVTALAMRAYSKSLMESMMKRFSDIPSAENYTLLKESMLRYQHDVMNLKIKREEE